MRDIIFWVRPGSTGFYASFISLSFNGGEEVGKSGATSGAAIVGSEASPSCDPFRRRSARACVASVRSFCFSIAIWALLELLQAFMRVMNFAGFLFRLARVR